MFLDEAKITVHGGKGGDGVVLWRKEKYVSRGGPWGGDGGKGGSVIFRANPQTDTLSAFAEQKVFHAEDGEGGGRKRMHGKNGKDLIMNVPPGTLIRENGKLVADLAKDGDEVGIARGGRGGFGNAHFTSSVRRAPDFAEKGEPGVTRELELELKLVADVGIIGLPSTGKSTLISVLSNARPKIAAYHFTTLVPNLGVVSIYDKNIVMCDVPGLIEGASQGKGLGDKFLRHIERCGVLMHLLDVSSEDLVRDYLTIRRELETYSPALAAKHELVVLNKIDLIEHDPTIFVEELSRNNISVFASISAATHTGTDDLVKKLLPIVLEEREKRSSVSEPNDIPVITPGVLFDRADAFTIKENPKGTFRVAGKRIEQIAVMTNWSSRGGVQRFRNICERSSLRRALEHAGATDDSTVFIGQVDVSGQWR